MDLNGLMEFSLKELGIRFFLIGILPSMLLVLVIYFTYISGVPMAHLDISVIKNKILSTGIDSGIFLLISILVLSIALIPTQILMTRILEGYWGNSVIMNPFVKMGVKIQWCRFNKLKDAETNQSDVTSKVLLLWKRHTYYPQVKERFLPTSLGNVLRSAEDLTTEKYGLDTITVWPRLYVLLPENLKNVLDDQRTKLDISVRFTFIFVTSTIVFSLFLFNLSWFSILPAITLFLAWISFKGAIQNALAYGQSIQTAFDLHRFELLKMLHLPLPKDRNSEKEQNIRLSNFLSVGYDYNFNYEH